MPLSVVRPGSVKAAVAALQADKNARFLGGGTLLVRARNSGERSSGGSSSPMASGSTQSASPAGRRRSARRRQWRKSSPSRSLLSCIPWRARSAARLSAPWRRSAAIFSPARPIGDFAVALLALAAEIGTENSKKSETIATEAFLKGRATSRRDRHAGLLSVSAGGRVPLLQDDAAASAWRACRHHRRGPSDRRRQGERRARRLWRDGADCDPRACSRESA